MDEKDFYIELLKLGARKGLDGTTVAEAVELAERLHFITEKDRESHLVGDHSIADQKKYFIEKIFNEGFHLDRKITGRHGLPTLESFFRLLDYQELVEARNTSREAKRYSSWAIGISVFSLLLSATLSIFLTNWQIESATEIQEDQFQELLQNTKVDLTPIEDRIDLLMDTLSSLKLESK